MRLGSPGGVRLVRGCSAAPAARLLLSLRCMDARSLSDPSRQTSPLRILLVEDEHTLRTAVADFLEANGALVACAGSLREAERALDGSLFDVAVLDVGLPDGDGLSLLRRISPDRSLVISARSEPERYAEVGIRHALLKPLDLVELTGLVGEIAEAAVAGSPQEPHTVVPARATPPGLPERTEFRTAWACRALDLPPHVQLLSDVGSTQVSAAGDVVAVEVESVGQHTRITTATNERFRLYNGDRLLGVLGDRYATDAFEGRVGSLEPLHLLTGAGMIGTVQNRSRGVKAPTRVRYLGHVADADGAPLNSKRALFRPAPACPARAELILVVGTGMNTGKTTAVATLVKALVREGKTVAACKLTGSVSHQDLTEMRATGAAFVRDFSDYGFPSTYLCEADELIGLFEALYHDAVSGRPDVIVLELADGVLQRETRILLEHPALRQRTRGVLLTAPCASSALFGVAELDRMRHRVMGVSGVITNSPLFVREFSERSPLPVCASWGDGGELAALVIERRAA